MFGLYLFYSERSLASVCVCVFFSSLFFSTFLPKQLNCPYFVAQWFVNFYHTCKMIIPSIYVCLPLFVFFMCMIFLYYSLLLLLLINYIFIPPPYFLVPSSCSTRVSSMNRTPTSYCKNAVFESLINVIFNIFNYIYKKKIEKTEMILSTGRPL